jgi:Flp pilus assembly pilin Flp
MSDDIGVDKLEVAFIIVAICMVIIAVVITLGYNIPNFLLLIIGISAIIVGALKVKSGLGY